MAVMDLRMLTGDSDGGGEGGVAVADASGGLTGVVKREEESTELLGE